MTAGHFLLIVRPYKKNWMNISDGLLINLLGFLEFNFVAHIKYYTFITGCILETLPMLIYIVYILYSLGKRIKLRGKVSKVISSSKACCIQVCCCKVAENHGSDPFLFYSYRRRRTLTNSESRSDQEQGEEMKRNLERSETSGCNSYGLV